MIPCPFCKSKNVDPRFALGDDGRIAAGCMDCGGTGPDGTTEEEAVRLWNQADHSSLRAALQEMYEGVSINPGKHLLNTNWGTSVLVRQGIDPATLAQRANELEGNQK